MKKNYTLTICVLLCCSSGLNAQINQLDSAGNKHGKWILYLDNFGNKLDDSTKAVFKRYTYYDHGTHVYPMGGFISKGDKIAAADSLQWKIGKPTTLNGEYKCYDKKGRIKFIHVFENGNYVSYTEFYSSGQKETFFDYKKHCDGQQWSWYMYTYDKSGDVTYQECIHKNPATGKWPKMRG